MSEDLKNILANLNKDVEQNKLLDYLNRQLTDKEQHELEQQLNDDSFMSDAMDGLSALGPNADVTAMVQELNTGLTRQLHKKKKSKKLYKQDGFVYYSVAIILLLAVVCYVIVKLFLKN